MARVKGDWLIKKAAASSRRPTRWRSAPPATRRCSASWRWSGTASSPERGPVVVTGAAGGVGSVAVALLQKLGYHVIASTGRAEEHDYLTGLGAAEIIGRDELSGAPKLLDKERWAGAVDTVGSKILANVIAMTKAGGAVAACGNAAGMDLPTSVAPFILRGVSLLGINSVTLPEVASRGGLVAPRARSRPQQARGDDEDDRLEDVPERRRRSPTGQVRGRCRGDCIAGARTCTAAGPRQSLFDQRDEADGPRSFPSKSSPRRVMTRSSW